MKAMLKSELAELAGVSTRTLMDWCYKHHWPALKAMGMTKGRHYLSPRICRFIAERYGIDLPE